VVELQASAPLTSGIYQKVDGATNERDHHSVSVDREEGDVLIQIRVGWKAVAGLVMVALPSTINLFLQHFHWS
jgi:hypothetical protein